MFFIKSVCFDLRELLFLFRLFLKNFLDFSIFVVCDRDGLSSDGFHMCASLFFSFNFACFVAVCVQSSCFLLQE